MDNPTTTPNPIMPKVVTSTPQMPVTPRPTPTPVPPPMPPIPPKPTQGTHREARVILPALLLVLIIGAIYYWYSDKNSAPAVPAETATSTSSAASAASDVHVTQVDLAGATAPAAKLPAGFPSDIPVETATITQSYSASYADHGVTQYTVDYTSSKSKDALWTLYTSYANSAGYTLDTTTNKAEGVLDATKGKNSLDVLVSPHGSMSLVQITYLARQ